MGEEKIITGSSSGANYSIEKEIGKGGQGRVFSIKGGKFALKLIANKSSSKSELLKRKISYLKTRPINDLPISIPLEQVEGKALGYIMEMATGMIPIENLIKPDSSKTFLDWWKDTGGLKKRVLILQKIAETLAKLHAKGLVYGDISLTNIFVSEESKHANIFFIDSDNITHESKLGTAVFTPGYAAPEIMQTTNQKATSGYDTYTDYFSYAIIAYQLLTLNHPFIGDYVNEGEPELEEKAYLGEIPWINHSRDKTNVTSSGIPSYITLSKKMMQAFKDTFEDGVKLKHKRSSVSKWSEIFSGAIDVIIECQNENCKQDFFFSSNLVCSFCEEQTTYVGVVRFFPLVKNIIEDIKHEFQVTLENIKSLGVEVKRIILTQNQYSILYEKDFLLNSSDKPLFKIKIMDDAFYIKGLEQSIISISIKDKIKKNVNISQEIKVELTNDLFIFIDELNNYQRVVKLSKHSL
jgi:serine/threonine protein kinase